MHHGLIKTLWTIVEEFGVPKVVIVEEARGMRQDDQTRSGDLVVMDFAEEGCHLIIDGVVTTYCLQKHRPREGGDYPWLCGEAGRRQEIQGGR